MENRSFQWLEKINLGDSYGIARSAVDTGVMRTIVLKWVASLSPPRRCQMTGPLRIVLWFNTSVRLTHTAGKYNYITFSILANDSCLTLEGTDLLGQSGKDLVMDLIDFFFAQGALMGLILQRNHQAPVSALDFVTGVFFN